jgi:TP901 family phage tail tape measure protein
MVDSQASIRVDIDLAQALADLKLLEKQIQFFNKSIVQGTAQAKSIQNEFNTSLLHNINATGKFTASMGKVHTETERFTNALEKNKFSAREYFRYSMASTKSFGRLFGKEFGTITKVAEERVKQLQARHIELGRAADGAMRSVSIVPKSLDYSKASTSMQLAIQKQQIFNRLLDSGTTKLLNFGKNTQWAGRQLMVGFTIPLAILGSSAIRTFKDMEMQAIRFKKVYGDMFTATSETDAALENIKNLATEFTKYGIAVSDTIKLAADAAAAGNAGKQLENVVTQATKLSVLGGVNQEQALDATIAIQNAFRVTGKELEDTINFLNAVENQTVVALDDITEAIPKVAPVIRQLGGDIKDLAFFMAAMQEGGVKASEAANALKSGLASLINPTKQASEMAAGLGINLKGIVDQNAGDLRMTVMSFAKALEPLDDLQKARLIEQIFGKFQFARISTLFDNVAKSGNQASRVLDIANESTEALAMTAEKELGVTASSSAIKFQASIEKLKASLVPAGQAFAEALTPIIEFAVKALEKFNSFSDGTKKGIVTLLAVLGGVGPVLLMSIGLVANGLANIGKGLNLLRKGYQNIVLGSGELGNATNYMTMEQLEALSVANNLHSAHQMLTNQFALESGALLELTTIYRQATAAATAFATANPGMVVPGTAKRLKTPKFGKPMAEGGWVPGTGNKDSVPTVLMPGEFVVRKDAAQANSQTLEQMNKGGQTYRGMGTPSFGKLAYRATGSQPTDPTFSHIQPNLGRVSSQDLRMLLDLGISQGDTRSQNVLELIRIANQAELLPRYQKSGAVIVGGAGLPLDYSLNNLLNVANDLTAKDFNPDGTLKEGKKAVTGRELKESLQRQLIQDSNATKETMGSLGVKKRDKEKFKNSLMYQMSLIDDNALYSDKGNTSLGIRSFFNDGQDIIERGLRGSGLNKREAKKRIESAKKAIREVRLNFAEPLYNFLKTEGAIEEVGSDGSTKRYRVRGESEVRQVYTHTPKATSFDKARTARVPISGASQTSPVPRRPRMDQLLKDPNTTLRFGAAANIAGRRMGPFFRPTAGGTPSYGEQGVTPAMLMPGEFVVNSQSAQQFGPQLQAMNQGGIAYRQDPSGPGYDAPNALQRRKRLKTPKFGNAMATRFADFVDPGNSQSGLAKNIKVLNNTIKTNVETIDKNTNVVEDGIKGNKDQDKKNKFAGKLGTASNIGFAVSGAAMAYGMMGQGKSAEISSNVGQIGMAVSSLAMFLPMLTNPTMLAVTAIAGFAGLVMLHNKTMSDAAKKGYETASLMGITQKEMQKVSDATGKIARSEVAKRQREEGVTYDPNQADFGTGFITTDAGKDLIESVKKFEKAGTDSAQAIAQKLSGFVLEGLMTAAQAESVALQLGRTIGSSQYGVKVRGEIIDLIGVDGTSALRNPIEIRVRLLEETEKSSTTYVNSLKKKVEKEISDSSEQGAFVSIPFMFRNYEQARDEGQNYLTAFLEGIGQFSQKDRLQKEFEGASLGQSDTLLRNSQQMIDSAKIEYEERKASTLETEKRIKAELISTTNSERKLVLENQLSIITKQKAHFEKQYADNSNILLQKQTTYYQDGLNSFKQLENEKEKAGKLDISRNKILEKFKGTGAQEISETVVDKLSKIKDKDVQYRINTLITSDQLDIDNASSLLTMFASDEKGISRKVDFIINEQGIESVNRLISGLSTLKDTETQKRLFNEISILGKTKFDSALEFLKQAEGIPEAFFDLSEVSKNLDSTEIAQAGEDLQKVEKELGNIGKLTRDQKDAKILEFISGDQDFSVLKDEVEYFKSLDDVNTKTFFTIFRTMSEEFSQEAAVAAYQEQNPMSYQYPGIIPKGNELKKWFLTNVTIPETKNFVEIMQQFPEIFGDAVEGADGGGSSIPIKTDQLIALRILGLDPAALSQLDYVKAAQILNSSAKEQKKVIAALNQELRENAIKAYALKSAEEVLEDQMSATSNAIGAYINMLESTSIKPVQDQIDKYTELTNKQQDQIDKYQKGLQQLSDKESNINKTYDSRISIIDKVSAANERAAQKQQRQISLASAIASGDFGAAAQAAADITSADAQAQLEDTRTALELQRQNDLKNLTVEINGILYTRETIETNIKNIDEEIYQRSLLIKAEQQKIADIEKTITAEKEKQRKLQVLTQISQLSTQMQMTVDQTQRQAMGAQIGYLGQSIGLDPNNPQSITNLSNQLGINAQALVDNLAKSQQVVGLTAAQFVKEFEKGQKLSGQFSKAIDETSVQGKLSLSYMTSLQNAWSGDEKKGVAGLVSTGTTIKNTLIGAGAAIVAGKKALDDALTAANIALAKAKEAQNTSPQFRYDPKTKKMVPVAFGGVMGYMGGGKVNKYPLGGLIPYMGGGKVRKYAIGGNINYKGSSEPAPARMNLGGMTLGSIAPGLGNTDRVPALLTPGEFVVRKSVAKENMGFLKALNGDVFPQLGQGLQSSSITPINSTTITGGTTLYNNNYSVNVNVAGTDASANDIANIVVRKIKTANDRNVRGSRY